MLISQILKTNKRRGANVDDKYKPIGNAEICIARKHENVKDLTEFHVLEEQFL